MTDEDLLWICEIAAAYIERVGHLEGHKPEQLDDLRRVEETERRIQAWRKQKFDFFASMRKPSGPWGL